jgi:uncharacterized membrane protein
MAGHRAPPEAHGLDFERLLFFSDAVFAIAITLLIIEVRLPPLPEQATNQALIDGLREILPSIFAYGLSFATIGLYWLAHWRRYRYVARVDERLVALNLVLLAFIAFIPFPTAVIGEHGDLTVAVILYAITLSAAGLLGPLTWLYAWRAGLVRPDVGARYARYLAFRGFSVPVVMLTSLLLLPLLGPAAVELSWLLIVPVQVAMNHFLHAREADPSH